MTEDEAVEYMSNYIGVNTSHIEEEYIPYYTFSFIKAYIEDVSFISEEMIQNVTLPKIYEDALASFIIPRPISEKTKRIMNAIKRELSNEEIQAIEDIINAND